MYAVIFGGGRIGYPLAKTLLSEGHEVLVLERNADISEHIVEELGSMCVQGDGCEVGALTDAGTERADMFIAVTDVDEDNLVACQLAKHRFNVPRTVACVNDPQNELIFTKLGIDVTINITENVLAHIQREVVTHPLAHLLLLKEMAMEIIEVKVLPESPIVENRVGDIHLPSESILSLIMGDEKRPMIPTVDTVIEADDRVIALVKTEDEKELIAVLTGK
jgi:trk system potassium uptake protein TrkA